MLPLENVHERLLRAGIKPRHARRYVTELREHLFDLVTQERASGLDARQADERARLLLGSDAQLTAAMLHRGAPRTLAARAPWAVFGIAPLVTLIIAMVLLGKWSMAYFYPYRALSASDIPQTVRAIGIALTFLGSYVIGPALAATCVVTAWRQRLASSWIWAGLALLALASGALGLRVEFLQPQSGAPGGIRGSVIQSTLLVMSIRALRCLRCRFWRCECSDDAWPAKSPDQRRQPRRNHGAAGGLGSAI